MCKTSITRLLDHDVLPNFVMQLSGHKSPESLESYHKASRFHQQKMTDLLSLSDESAAKRSTVSSASFYDRETTLFTDTRPSASRATSTTPKVSFQGGFCSQVVPVSHKNKDEVISTGVYVKSQDYTGLFSGANIRNCVFNFCHQKGSDVEPGLSVCFKAAPDTPPQPRRRRAFIIESDSEDDLS